MNRIQTVLGSAAVAALMAVTPVFASADTLNANASNGVVISSSGIVHVVGANVTAVGSNFVNAALTLGTTIVNWLVNISDTTKIGANGSANASTTDIAVGDKINFSGSLTSLGSTITVAASKVRDVTSFPKLHGIIGKVTSVNTASSTLTIKAGDRSITVQAIASTTISVNSATSTLAAVHTGSKVKVTGTVNAVGTVITASKITVKGDEGVENGKKKGDKDKKDKKEGKKDDDDRISSNKGSSNFKSILARFHFGNSGKDN